MNKTDPQTKSSTAAADPVVGAGFTEHRPPAAPSKSAVNPPAKSAEITAETQPDKAPAAQADKPSKEIGGPKGPEPTRYGDWERDGRCVDF
jgi:hypothetical protein